MNDPKKKGNLWATRFWVILKKVALLTCLNKKTYQIIGIYITPGHRPFTPATRVQISLGTPTSLFPIDLKSYFFVLPIK
jgi:hypothetical protein